jgi:hypothetical protein
MRIIDLPQPLPNQIRAITRSGFILTLQFTLFFQSENEEDHKVV